MEPFPQFLRRYASIPFYKVPLAVPWHFNLGAGLLMAPQLYWFFLICRGALRLFTGSSRSQRSHASTAAAKEQQTDGHTPPQPSNGYSGRPSEPELTSHWVVGWAGGDEERREMRMYQWVRKLSRRPETSSNKGEKKKEKLQKMASNSAGACVQQSHSCMSDCWTTGTSSARQWNVHWLQDVEQTPVVTPSYRSNSVLPAPLWRQHRSIGMYHIVRLTFAVDRRPDSV